MSPIKLGTNLPEHLILEDPGALKEFLQAIESMGYGYITVGDHVLGADTECLSLIHISEPTRPPLLSRMPSSA